MSDNENNVLDTKNFKYILFTKFSRTKRVMAELRNVNPGETHTEEIWVSKPSHWELLDSEEYKDKKVAIITRERWNNASNATQDQIDFYNNNLPFQKELPL